MGKLSFLPLCVFLPASFLPLDASGETPQFRRGDSSGDSLIDLGDAVATLRFLFLHGVIQQCLDAADANDDGALDISDALFTINFLFLGGALPPEPGLACGEDPTGDGLDCRQYWLCGFDGPHPPGAGDFEVPVEGPPQGFECWSPVPSPWLVPGLLRREGDRLSFLNRHRGLQVFDIGDPVDPQLTGRVHLPGRPQGLHIVGERAIAIVDRASSYTPDDSAFGGISRSFGTQVRLIDLSDPRRPAVAGSADLEGDCIDSRVRGDALYVAIGGLRAIDFQRRIEVMSLRIDDPARFGVLGYEDFPAWKPILSTEEGLYLGRPESEESPGGPRTRIRFVDLRDPEGVIRPGEESVIEGGHLPGAPSAMAASERQGVLRVAAVEGEELHLTLLDVRDRDRISLISRSSWPVGERRDRWLVFQGPSLVVSPGRGDSISLFDLARPEEPAAAGGLSLAEDVLGLAPAGDRVIAIGRPADGFPCTLTLLEVSSPGGLSVISRAAMDGAPLLDPGDDPVPTFQVLDALGLVLFPLNEGIEGPGLGMVELRGEGFGRASFIPGTGWMERALGAGEGTVLALSGRALDVLDVSDRGAPRLRGSLEIAREVGDLALLGDHMLQLTDDWLRGRFQICVTPLDDPDAPIPLARVDVAELQGRLFTDGTLAFVAGVVDSYPFTTRVQVFDFADPLHPRERGSSSLPYRSIDAVLTAGPALVFLGFDCGSGPGAGRVHSVDLRDPDHPVLSGPIVLPEADGFGRLAALGDVVHFSSSRTREADGGWVRRSSLHRIRISDPSAPVLLPTVDIPGEFAGLSPASGLYTQERWWDRRAGLERAHFHHLELVGDRASLGRSIEVPPLDSLDGLPVAGEAAFLIAYPASGFRELVALDLAGGEGPRISVEVEVPFLRPRLMKVEGGLAIIQDHRAGDIGVLDVSDISHPEFRGAFSGDREVRGISRRGDRVFIPGGIYGVHVIRP